MISSCDVIRGLSPTPIAQEMYPAIKQALNALRVTLAEARGFDPGNSTRHFRLSIPHPMGPFYALDVRKALAAIAPGIVLTFETVSRPVNLEEHLRDGIVDLAIDWLPVELDRFVNKKLFDDRVVLLARKDRPTANACVTIEDLRKEQFITPHRRRDAERMPPVLRELHNLQLPEAVRVSELLEIPTVVASTDLLGPMLSSMAPLLEKRLGVQAIPIPLELPSLPIYVIWHETHRNDIAHRWLRELVGAEIGRQSPRTDKGG